MGVLREPVEDPLELLMEEGVAADVVVPATELLVCRELAVDQQVGDLEEGGPLGELLDWVAAVAQDARLAVEEGDRAPRRRSVRVAVVERGQPGPGQQLADVDGRLARRPVLDRELQGRLADLGQRSRS